MASGMTIVFQNLKNKLNVDCPNLSPYLLQHGFLLASIEHSGDAYTENMVVESVRSGENNRSALSMRSERGPKSGIGEFLGLN